MMRQIALVSATGKVSLAEVAQVAAALQRQVLRDLAPLWGLKACVSAFPSLREIPVGYWPVVVADGIPQPGAAGLHLDRHGSPYCLVEAGPTWALAASHECLAMLVDPSGSRQIWGPSPLPGQGEVGFLVEVADPCQDIQFGYMVDGILVSDFCTPAFFEPERGAGRYSFTGAVERPLEALKNGYLSWFDPKSRAWYQQRHFGRQPKFGSLGVPSSSAHRCLREFTNGAEADHRRLSHFSATATQRLQPRLKQQAEASSGAADLLYEEIGDLGRRLAAPALAQRG